MERSDQTGLAFSRDGQTLATAKHTDEVRLWDVKTGHPLCHTQQGSRISGVAFLPDGQTLVTSSWKQDFRVWDISNRTNLVFAGMVSAHMNEV
ncbi:MAG: WD40 repeat domain-containing protein [Verrucomicrobia bacterium]|nr:WD40 repeat domain-containing protein [Verrucomicrobiota bacterium]